MSRAFAPLLLSGLLAACGARPLTGELELLSSNLESSVSQSIPVDPETITDPNVRELRERAMSLLSDSRQFFDAALERHKKRSDDQTELLSRIGLIYYNAAENFYWTAESRVRVNEANVRFEEQRQRRNDYQNRLSSEQELIALLETVNRLFEANEELRRQLATVEEQGRTVNRSLYAIQESRMLQRDAQGVNATRYAAATYDTASASLNRAQALYDDEEYEEATQVALEALEQFRRAIEEARPAFTEQQSRLLENDTARAIFERVQRTFGDTNAYVDNRGIVVVIPYLFDAESDAVRAEQVVKLDEIAAILDENSRQRVAIEGHTQDAGSTADNATLGEQRAIAVRDVLTNRGIRSNRIETSSFGEDVPRFSNENDEGKRNNDRVELIFTF
jgi:outer membrane protein OmpA-like peptidoglycan-associated protein